MNKSLIKWVHWPTLNQELGDKKLFLKGRILNAGSGTRNVFLPNAERIVNIDIQNLEGVDVVGDLERMPFSNEEFDGILNVAVLEHCPHPWKVFLELNRVLKKGGILLCIVPFAQPIHNVPDDYFRFAPSGLKRMLIDNNFEIISFDYGHSFFHVIGWIMEDFFKRRSIILQIVFYPIAKIFYLLTRWSKFNIESLPCVINVVATKH
jgi:SAM-dependent methyltransferase